jgi:hypothetical protein
VEYPVMRPGHLYVVRKGQCGGQEEQGEHPWKDGGGGPTATSYTAMPSITVRNNQI